MRHLAVVMPTMDRSPWPNYLNITVGHLLRSGIATAKRIADIVIVNSGGPTRWPDSDFETLCTEAWGQAGVHNSPPRIESHTIGQRRLPHLNTATALMEGARTGAPWILFLEDDIDVCADFIDGVAMWLDDHSDPQWRVYVLGAAYPEVGILATAGKTCWQYPIKGFFGTQAFAIRRDDARDLALWLHERDPRRDMSGQYDLLMKEWALARWPDVSHFLASVPSFVQHIGGRSSIAPERPVHVFDSWPGRHWSYARSPSDRA